MPGHLDELVVVHRVAEGNELDGYRVVPFHDLTHSGRLVDTALQHIDPVVSRRGKYEVISQLAREHICHVHDVLVAVDGYLDDVDAREGQLRVYRLGQVLVELRRVRLPVIQEKGARAVEQRQMHATELIHELDEFPQRDAREYLPAQDLAAEHHLRTV